MRNARFIALSLAVHAVAFVVFRATVPGRDGSPPGAAPPAVRIRIVEALPRLAPKPGSEAETAPRQPTLSRPVPKLAVPAEPGPADPGAKIESYEDLFPRAADAAATASADSRTADSARSFDPEGDAIPRADQDRSLGKLAAFTREFAERLSIPASVKALSSHGKAALRLTRAASGWRITAATGDPYYRSLLYEAARELPPNGYLFTLLDATAYDTVRISFALTPVLSLDLSAKPVEVSTRSNQAFIAMTHKQVDERWKLGMPIDEVQGDDSVMPNLIGVGQLIWDRVHQTDPAEDLDAKRLRLSPAFARPIGR